MDHPNTRIRLVSPKDTLILSEYVRTWKRYHGVLRRFRELMLESPTDLRIEVGA